MLFLLLAQMMTQNGSDSIRQYVIDEFHFLTSLMFQIDNDLDKIPEVNISNNIDETNFDLEKLRVNFIVSIQKRCIMMSQRYQKLINILSENNIDDKKLKSRLNMAVKDCEKLADDLKYAISDEFY